MTASKPARTPAAKNIPAQKKHLRTLGHHLKPIVTISERGITEGVAMELERALEDHELIKIRLATPDPATRKLLAESLCSMHTAELVHQIGKVALLYRPAKTPNPRLSNLQRFS